MELTQNNLQAHFLLHIRSNAWVYKVFIYVKPYFSAVLSNYLLRATLV